MRIALGDDATASRVLDMGAEAIIAPMVNSVAEARALAAATKYPPLGERSWGPMRAMTLEGIDQPLEYLASANQTSFTFAMIETVRALDALDAILAVDGIDGVFVGPFDLSVSLSAGRQVAPGDASIDEPIRHIAERAAAAGKVAGIYAPTPERARTFREFGYRFIAVAADQTYLTFGAAELLRIAGAPVRQAASDLARRLAEDAVEDRVDVLQVVAEVEQRPPAPIPESPERLPGLSSTGRGNRCPPARPAWRCAGPAGRRPRG